MCAMFEKMDKFLQIAPHSLAIVLCRTGGDDLPAASDELQHHHTGYEIFADFKAENMQHFWNKKVTDAVSETFFLGWIDEHVLLIQGKEDHLEVLREGWMRRALKPPRGFEIKYLGKHLGGVVSSGSHIFIRFSQVNGMFRIPGALMVSGAVRLLSVGRGKG
ncbi:STOX1 protein, partial [Polypterus senegalus]